jgi:hypothetical protein
MRVVGFSSAVSATKVWYGERKFITARTRASNCKQMQLALEVEVKNASQNVGTSLHYYPVSQVEGSVLQ